MYPLYHDFIGSRYDLLQFNCNHFSHRLSEMLQTVHPHTQEGGNASLNRSQQTQNKPVVTEETAPKPQDDVRHGAGSAYVGDH